MFSRLIFKLLRLYGKIISPPSYAMEEKWHNLFILDSCRADIFKEIYPEFPLLKESVYQDKESSSSSSPEFVEKNFCGKYFGDCILISANPYPATMSPDAFYYRFDAWSHLFDKHVNNVRPEDIHEVFMAYRDRFPEKRIIVWFMQPHIPFITAPHLFEDYNFESRTKEIANEGTASSSYRNIWEKVLDGEVESNEVWEGYKGDLRLVLDIIAKNHSPGLGQTVITADHGEICKRFLGVKLFGHPSRIRDRELITVPWLVLKGDLPDTVSEKNCDHSAADMSELNETLKKFGYWD
ncbi:MAG: hypothetical protein ACKVLK_14285 [Spongiibacter sp.]